MKKSKKLKKAKKTKKIVRVRAKPVRKPVSKPVASHKVKPVKLVKPEEPEVREPKKLKLPKDAAVKYKKLLLDLRDHLIDGVSFLATDNLKRSQRDVSGELSGYSMHMADAGTDNFDREFALSLVSGEQEAIYEIGEALKRIEESTFGLCQMCEKPVRRERLEAVPFARLCVHCQSSIEKDRRGISQAVPVFGVTAEEESAEAEESEE